MIFLVVLVWFAGGFINYGLTLGRFTRDFPYMSHVGVSVFAFFMGFVGLPGVLIDSLVHGGFSWRIKPILAEERFKLFKAKYPSLERDHFNKYYA